MIPESFRGKRVVLHLERPRWESTVWLGSKKIGSARSLVAPHEFDLGLVEPGNASSDRPRRYIDDPSLPPRCPRRFRLARHELERHRREDGTASDQPDMDRRCSSLAGKPSGIQSGATRSASVKIKIGNSTRKSWNRNAFRERETISRHLGRKWWYGRNRRSISRNARSWNEFDPVLQKLKLILKGDNADDTREVSFGFREIKTVGKEFQLNGRRIYFRGTHHGGDFPLTGYPPTDVAYWQEDLPDQQRLGHQPHPVSFLLPARSRVSGCR